MAWRVDQIEDVVFAGLVAIVQAHGVGFDRDATLALQVHVVQNLRGHLALGKRAGEFQQPVGRASTCHGRYGQ